MMYKQIIIARKDLNMTPGKLAAQCSHAAMAFLTNLICHNAFSVSELLGSTWDFEPKIVGYNFEYVFDKDLYEQWINGSFTKVVLQAKNKNHLLKAKTLAEELGMVENKNFFLIRDNCNTELEPEGIDENGIGRTLTCIGFTPMDSKIIDQIGKKYQLYK